MKILYLTTIMLTLLTSLLSGCTTSAKGPFFQELIAADPAKAIVYVYSHYIPGLGLIGGYGIKTRGSFVVQLVDGGYYPFLVNPGEVTIELEAPVRELIPITLHTEAGHSYFIRPHIWMIGPYSKKIELEERADREIAISEIAPCRLILDPAPLPK